MNKSLKITVGVVLIIIGLLWTLSSFGITVFSVNSLFQAIRSLWPLVFVVGGLNIIIDSQTVNTVLWVVLLVFVLLLAIYYTNYGYSTYFYEDIYRFFFH